MKKYSNHLFLHFCMKSTAFVLVVAMMLTTLPLYAVAAVLTSGSCGRDETDNVTWTISTLSDPQTINGVADNKRLTIRGQGAMDDFVQTQSGSTNAPWQESAWDVTSLIIDEGITHIGANAFLAASYFVCNVSLPSTLETIGDYAFCGSLKYVKTLELPQSVTAIGSYAFYNTGLESVVISGHMSSIPDNAFASCKSLSSITIPAGVTTIDDYAFDGCTNLQDVYFGGSASDWAKITCGVGNNALNNATVHITPVAVTEVSLDITSKTLFVGDTITLTPTIIPENADDKTVTWSSSNEAVASVSNGIVSAKSTGSATISVTTTDGTKVARCAISVQAAPDEQVVVTSVSVSKSSASLKVGEALMLTATVLPSNATNKTVLWTSSNPSVAGVVDGTIMAKAAGSTIITASSVDGTKTASCTVTVTSASGSNLTVLASGQCGKNNTGNVRWTLYTVSGSQVVNNVIDGKRLVISGAGEMEDYVQYQNGSTNAPWQELAWDVTSIVVDEGVTSIGNNAFLCASYSVCSVSLPDSLQSIGAYAFSSSLKYVKTLELPQSISIIGDYAFASTGLKHISLPSQTTSLPTGTFSGCSSLASVTIPKNLTSINKDSFYMCSALTDVYYEGSAVDWGSMKIASGNSDLLSANIRFPRIPVTSVELNLSSKTLYVGDTIQLTATVSPSTADNQAVLWESSDSRIATVENGLVTAISVGSTDITVTTEDGDKQAACTITVQNRPVSVTGISLNKTSLTMAVGKTEALVATIIPENATNQELLWESSDNQIATVKNGVVTAVSAGTANITATTEDGGKTAVCIVTAQIPDTSGAVLRFETDSLRLWTGDVETLQAIFDSTFSGNKNLVWESSSDTVATVENGVITAHTKGNATITATTEDGLYKASCSLEVYKGAFVESFTIWETKYGTQYLTSEQSYYRNHAVDVSWSPLIYSMSTDDDYDIKSIVEFDVVADDGTEYHFSCQPYWQDSYNYGSNKLLQYLPAGKTYTVTAKLRLVYFENYWVITKAEYTSNTITVKTGTCSYYKTEVSDEYLAETATCGTPAKYYLNCSYCGVNYNKTTSRGEVDPDNHVCGEWVNIDSEYHSRSCECGEVSETVKHTITHYAAKEASCTESGWAAYDVCEDCCYSTYAEISPLNHLDAIDPAIEPTCTSAGTTEGKHCSRCGDVFISQKTIIPLGHKDQNGDGRCDTCNTVRSSAPDPIAEGTCDDDIVWTLDAWGTLEITGTGYIPSYSTDSPAPWNACNALVCNVVIASGVTSVGEQSFFGCERLTQVAIPATVHSIATDAFAGCTSLEHIFYGGSQTAWDAISSGVPDSAIVHCDCISNGTLGIAAEISWCISDSGKLDIFGELADGNRICVATYDTNQKMVGVQIVDTATASIMLSEEGSHCKIFLLGFGFVPRCPAVPVNY